MHHEWLCNFLCLRERSCTREVSPLAPFCCCLPAAGYLSSYEDIVSTSRPVVALAPDGSPVSLRQALLPLVEEILRHRSSGGSLAASVAAPPSPMAASAAGGVQSLPGTPVARSSSNMAEDGGVMPAAQASTDAELPVASEASGGRVGAADGDEASSSSTAAAAAAEPPPPAAGASDGAGNAGQPTEAAAGEAAQAGEAAALLERAATDKRLLIGGTCPPLDTPLAWLHAQLHAPDFFLYAVLHLPLPR